MPETNPNTELSLLIGIVVSVFFIPALIGFCVFINDFSRELKYLNNEIGKKNGGERRYWNRQKRRLWLSLIPFVKYRQD